MKRYSRRNRRRIRRRRSSLSASNWGPVLALTGTVLGVLAVIALVVFVALPKLLPLIGVEYRAPFAPTPTPAPTPVPTPTPHPMSYFVPSEAQNEVVFENSGDYKWFGDPYFYDGVMLLSAGKLVDSYAVMQDLYFFYPETRTAEQVPVTLENAHFMFPKFNEKWLIYLDARLDGGGYLMASDRTAPGAKPVLIKEIYTGQPEPMLDGDTVAWIERTGTRMDKLFVCDLNTMETTTLSMFSNSVYGQSLPSLRNGLLCWADAESGGGTGADTSVIYSIRISSSTVRAYSPGTYVHDPECDGTYSVWMDSHHAPDGALYYSKSEGEPVKIAEGVVEFGLGSHFVAYSKDEAIWAYMFDNGRTYRISAEQELAQFLGVSDDRVSWMDVTTRARDIVKFAAIPE
ncbi:MAG: hypothetical protein KIC63_01085 [Clostridium sp.]|jgi:hypothetical protein|nr:hypothetical protein [Clostridium sp.]MCI5915755.1 hypothetical protein [Christensenella sp.]